MKLTAPVARGSFPGAVLDGFECNCTLNRIRETASEEWGWKASDTGESFAGVAEKVTRIVRDNVANRSVTVLAVTNG
jgi:hypothetical protein